MSLYYCQVLIGINRYVVDFLTITVHLEHDAVKIEHDIDL